MTIPTIHGNGTSRRQLMEDLEAAHLSLEIALEKMKETAPNGRDYYPQGPDAIRWATRAYCDRIARVEAVKNEIGELIMKVWEAKS